MGARTADDEEDFEVAATSLSAEVLEVELAAALEAFCSQPSRGLVLRSAAAAAIEDARRSRRARRALSLAKVAPAGEDDEDEESALGMPRT